MRNTINLTGNNLLDICEKSAYRNQMEYGEETCRMCHGDGYIATVSGPITCPCVLKRVNPDE